MVRLILVILYLVVCFLAGQSKQVVDVPDDYYQAVWVDSGNTNFHLTQL